LAGNFCVLSARCSAGEAGLVTWGGEPFNLLLAALLTRDTPGRRFFPTSIGINGPFGAVTLSIQRIRDLAAQAEQDNDLPLSVAGRFTSPSRFLGELSNRLAAEARLRSI